MNYVRDTEDTSEPNVATETTQQSEPKEMIVTLIPSDPVRVSVTSFMRVLNYLTISHKK